MQTTKDVIRVSVDMPTPLYKAMHEQAENEALSHRAFIVRCVRDYLDRLDPQPKN